MLSSRSLYDKYLNRFNTLIKEGEQLVKSLEPVFDPIDIEVFEDLGHTESDDFEREACRVDLEAFISWKTRCITLLGQILPEGSIQRSIFEEFLGLQSYDFEYFENPRFLISKVEKLKAVKDDFEQGFLEDLTLQIEASISVDYMKQAEQLLAQDELVRFNHLPAAVLAGVVLERALRTLCIKYNLPTEKPKGDKPTPHKLGQLIEELKKADKINEGIAKQLRAWADVRNQAAHGRIDQFTPGDVNLMIIGIQNFFNEHLPSKA